MADLKCAVRSTAESILVNPIVLSAAITMGAFAAGYWAAGGRIRIAAAAPEQPPTPSEPGAGMRRLARRIATVRSTFFFSCLATRGPVCSKIHTACGDALLRWPWPGAVLARPPSTTAGVSPLVPRRRRPWIACSRMLAVLNTGEDPSEDHITPPPRWPGVSAVTPSSPPLLLCFLPACTCTTAIVPFFPIDRQSRS